MLISSCSLQEMLALVHDFIPLQTETGAPLLQRYFAVIVGVTLVYEGYQTWFHGAQGRDDELELFTAYASVLWLNVKVTELPYDGIDTLMKFIRGHQEVLVLS